MASTDPFDRFVANALHESFNPLQVETIIRLVDEGGEPGPPLDSTMVSLIVERAYRRTFGPIHEAHINHFAGIPDWTLSGLSIHAVTAAIVDPFIDALMADDARLFHVCCQALIQTQQPLPRDLWWTPVFSQCLDNANPGIRRHNPSPKLVLAQINFACYHYCFRGMCRADLPLREDDPVRPAYGYRRGLRRIVKGFFTMLLDELQKGSDAI